MATVRVQLRRGTEQQWYDANPVLAAGEVGIETDTNTFKFGDGATAWRVLDYALSDTVDDYIPLSTKGVANGVASLDASGFIPTAQLPPLAKVTVSAVANTAARLALTAEAGDIAIEADSGQSYVLSASPASTDANWKALVGSEAVVDLANAALVASTGLSKTYDDSAGTITFSASSAIATAAADATAKANSAIDTAASDATTKANAAQAAAIANTTTQINNLIDSAPGTLNTLGEIATALAADESAATALTTLVNTKAPLASPTFTGVVTIPSGASISGFATLAAPTFTGTVTLPASTTIGNVTNVELSYLDGVTSTVQGQIDAKQDSAIAATTYAPLASPTLTGTVTLPESTSIGNVSNLEIGYVNGVTSGIQSQIDAKLASATAATTYAPLASPTLTGTVTLPESTSIGDVSNLEIGYLNGVTSGIQTQLDAKQAVVANVSDVEIGYLDGVTSAIQTQLNTKQPVVANVSDVEIGHLDGVTSSIQTQIDTKAPLASPTFTGTVTLPALTVSSSMLAADAVTSGKIANGTIINEDISATAEIATSKISGLDTALGLKAPLASPTFTGVVTIPSGASISGFAPLASPTFTGTVTTGHILPATDVSSDLGSPAKMWRDIYVGPGSLYVNGQKVLQTDAGDVVITADANENLALRTSGSGNIELDPTGAGTVSIKGPMVIEAAANITSADGNGINFGSTINADAISSKTLNTDLSLSGNGTGKVYLNDNAEVNGNLVIGGNLTVSGTTTTVNSETISLSDNIIDLNSNFTTGSPTENAGIKIKRGDSSDVQIRWNESTDKWEFTTDGTNYSVIAPTDSPTFTGTNSVAALTASGLITASASGVAFTDGTQTKAGIPSLTTIGTTISAAYNLSTGGLTLRDQLIPISGTYVVTVPTNATTAFPVGTSIDFYQSAGTVASFAGAGGVTIQATPGLKLRTTYSSATLTKVATDTWLLAGDLTA